MPVPDAVSGTVRAVGPHVLGVRGEATTGESEPLNRIKQKVAPRYQHSVTLDVGQAGKQPDRMPGS